MCCRKYILFLRKSFKSVVFSILMLTPDISSQINNFVAQKPRTIQEVAELLGKNWRTAESYVERISVEQGTIAMRTFRGGTKGGLKIVYWNVISKNQSTFQERLFEQIVAANHKDDFSPFDIYQYVDDGLRECFLETQEENVNVRQDLLGALCGSQEQILIFSGDLSWSKASQQGRKLLEGFDILVSRGIPIKIVARIDLNAKRNAQEILALNAKYGKELIEIRHAVQPLRAFVIDQKMVRFKEKYFLLDNAQHRYLFYSIRDENWVSWTQKVFWHFYSTGIAAQKRFSDLESIREIGS